MRKVIVAVVVVAVVISVWRLWPTAERRVPIAEAAATRDTAQGQVVGFVDDSGAYAWLGIPYAAPPVGELRWRATQPPAAWSGQRGALANGDICVQYPSLLSGVQSNSGSGDDSPIGAEDCLYLNIWAPPRPATALPVMVWIHGGGNSIGQGGTYVGGRLATSQDVVVVTLNYRLGPFGWFLLPGLATPLSTPEDRSGNYGLLDIIAALRWVRQNIAAFGGDPDNVTIFGESAGGADVLALLTSPLAQGLFQRAIAQSGGLFRASPSAAANYVDDAEAGSRNSSREIVNKLLIQTGRAADRTAAKTLQQSLSSAELHALLYAQPAADVLSQYDGGGFGIIDAPLLFSDGYVLPAQTDPAALFSDRANYNAVPVMLGSNRDEVALFMVRDPRFVERRFWLFPRLKDPAAYRRQVRYQTDSWKIDGVDSIATALARTQPGEVFAYRFDWDEEGSVMGYDLAQALGAAHGLEIAFVFGEFSGGLGLSYLYPATPERDELVHSMMSYWSQFAYSGSPGRGRDATLPAWLAWGRDGQSMLLLDTTTDGGPRMTSEVLTAADLKRRLLTNVSIVDQRERCGLYAQLFQNDDFNEQEYLTLGANGCGAYDPRQLRSFEP
jgi:para-nitrobenzyl esterase